MGKGHKDPPKGMFGEEAMPPGNPAEKPKLAGLFGTTKATLRDQDRKSPAEKAAPQRPDHDEEDGDSRR
jgi:hypothetical protein